MGTICHDVRQAVSQLHQSPGFTGAAIVILGFGLALTLSAVAVVASLIPALRAMRVTPMEALRYE